MIKAKNGDAVKVHYEGKFSDGVVFDSSFGNEALEFVIGKGQMIHGFEQAVLDMQIGEKKTAYIKAVDAYGEVFENLIFDITLNEIPPELVLELGMQLNAYDNEGRAIPVVVKDILPDKVVLDANHPLAGKDLIFEIQLMEIIS